MKVHDIMDFSKIQENQVKQNTPQVKNIDENISKIFQSVNFHVKGDCTCGCADHVHSDNPIDIKA